MDSPIVDFAYWIVLSIGILVVVEVILWLLSDLYRAIRRESLEE
jgi:hypothetical protein